MLSLNEFFHARKKKLNTRSSKKVIKIAIHHFQTNAFLFSFYFML